MKKIDFIKWALPHAQKYVTGKYPIEKDQIATEPWGYILGTQGELCTTELIKQKRYLYPSWSNIAYYRDAQRWINQRVTDCQGLVDCYVSIQNKKRKDINAKMGFANSKTKSAAMNEMPKELGIAVYYSSIGNQRAISHVGFICGFIENEPLIIEAKGIKNGVIITKYSSRKWNYWSKQDDVFES